MGDRPQCPEWMEAFLERQTDTITQVLDKHLSRFGQHESPPSPPKKKSKSDSKDSMPQDSPNSHPRDPDDDDDFDRRFGHLIGVGSQVDDENNGYLFEDAPKDYNQDDDDDSHSVDEDLLLIQDKVPNWDTSSSIRKFVCDSADVPLPDEMIKKLNSDYVPKEELQSYFSPPDMPSRLMRIIKSMKSKGAIKTERALYSAQSELFVIAKPLLAALIELRPLGSQVSTARELLSISLRGIFSVSLKISRARRENVRFLFKDALGEVLYTYAPRYCSLFGGDSFASQVEKAAKEAKIDLSWSKPRPSFPYQPFRNSGSQGFRYSGGASQYINRQDQRGRRGGYNNRGGSSRGNNYNKSSYQKPKRGSGASKKN